jgi:hypothetical protein
MPSHFLCAACRSEANISAPCNPDRERKSSNGVIRTAAKIFIWCRLDRCEICLWCHPDRSEAEWRDLLFRISIDIFEWECTSTS